MNDHNRGAAQPGSEQTPAAVPAHAFFEGRFREPRIILLCFALTVIFYFQALTSFSHNAVYLYSGDIDGFYLPTMMKIHSVLHGLHLTALDYSLYNGSSDFYLSPNLFTFHPLVIIYALFAPMSADTTSNIGQYLTFMMFLHSIIALYFTHRLLNLHLKLDFGAALLGAMLFTFNVHLVDALGQPPFFFIVTVLPWACCALIENIEQPGIARTIFASAPIVLMLVGGYIPLGLAGVEFSTLMIGAYLLYTRADRQLPLSALLNRTFWAATPVAIGVATCSLYVFALYLFGKETDSTSIPNLFYSAHQYAESPSGLLRALSCYWIVPGPAAEFSLVVGLVPIALAMVFVFSARAIGTLRRPELFTLLGCGVACLIGALAIFGPYSVTSDMIYYFAPQIGRMHIYQRFLPFCDLAFAAMVALMVVAIGRLRPSLTSRAVLALFGVLTALAAYMFAYHGPVLAQAGVKPQIVIELLCATLALAALLVPNKGFMYLAIAVLAVMPATERMYHRPGVAGSVSYSQVQKLKPFYTQPSDDAALVAYIKKRSSKPYVKYADLTPMWRQPGVETFPKVFPYLVENEINLSSYTGFTFYLSERAKYRQRMPLDGDIRLRPDWTSLLNTGADFLVVDAHEAQTTGLGGMVALADAFPLSNGVVFAPLIHRYPSDQPPLYDNGMIRITPADAATPPRNLALGARASAFPAASPAQWAVDGGPDGDLAKGSVALTGQDRNAWIQVDLGKSQPIGRVRLWNRTDCCAARIENAWLFVSDTPFADKDTAADIKSRSGVFAQQILASQRMDVEAGGTVGRYVRVQLPGDEKFDDAFLNLAELEVYPPTPLIPAAARSKSPVVQFQANYANRVKAVLDLAAPAQFSYEFSDNPRLTYLVDGKPVKFETATGAPTYVLPAGRHTVEIKYRNHPLLAFWILYFAYWLVVLATLGLELAGRSGVAPRRRLQAFEQKCLNLLPRAFRPAAETGWGE